MNIIGNDITYSIECTNGLRYDETTTPPGIRPCVEAAMERGRTSGSLGGGGLFWRWCRTPFDRETINIEFTSQGQVAETHAVPRIAWLAFSRVAESNGFEAEDHLVIALAGCLAEGMNLVGALAWLMPSESAEMLEAHYAELV